MSRPGVIALIALFICILIAAAGYFLLIGPKKGTIDKKQKELEKYENLIETEKGTFKALSDVRNRSAEYEARLASIQAMIPAEPDLPSLIRNIQAAADPGKGAGLPWLSFSPGDVQSSSGVSGGPSTGYSTYSFTMTAAGFYDEVVDLIYRMERFKRAVVVDSVSMTPITTILQVPYSPNLGLVQAQIGARAFTFATPFTGTSTTQQQSSQPVVPQSQPTGASTTPQAK